MIVAKLITATEKVVTKEETATAELIVDRLLPGMNIKGITFLSTDKRDKLLEIIIWFLRLPITITQNDLKEVINNMIFPVLDIHDVVMADVEHKPLCVSKITVNRMILKLFTIFFSRYKAKTY